MAWVQAVCDTWLLSSHGTITDVSTSITVEFSATVPARSSNRPRCQRIFECGPRARHAPHDLAPHRTGPPGAILPSDWFLLILLSPLNRAPAFSAIELLKFLSYK